MTSIWGNSLKLSIFGQSHGRGLGMVLDGLPAGIELDLPGLRAFMKRRAPGQTPWSSPRREDDEPQFLAGLENGQTCGAPLAAIIENQNAQSEDYESRPLARPAHADFAAWARYGSGLDLRGGGHFSGRLTAPLCLAGGVCLQILAGQNIYIGAHILDLGGHPDLPFDPVDLTIEQLLAPGLRDFPVNDPQRGQKMQAAIAEAKEDGDSLGGIIECGALGLPAGLGNPLFAGLENRLAGALFAIPGLKGLEFGAGFAAAHLRGSQNNDDFIIKDGHVRTKTNNHGGILGGISSGMPLLLRGAFKPTPSIAKEQQGLYLDPPKTAIISSKGRHDPSIVPRAVPCIEAVTALVLLDMLLEQQPQTIKGGKD